MPPEERSPWVLTTFDRILLTLILLVVAAKNLIEIPGVNTRLVLDVPLAILVIVLLVRVFARRRARQ